MGAAPFFLGSHALPSACADIALFPSRGRLTASVTQGISHHLALAVQGPRQCHPPCRGAEGQPHHE